MPDEPSPDSPGPNSPGTPRARRVSSSVGRAAKRGTNAARRGGTAAVSSARKFTHSGGAGESGLSRLLELHAFNAAGDAAIAISLAGTLFFTVPTEQASGQVALFLVLTMLPFALVAPLIGPLLDRFRRGRRWAIGATFAIRAFCCWVLAGSIADESPTFFLAALGCLISSKAYGVTRAAAVPRLLPREFTLVKANSRISLTGTGAAIISAPIAGLAATVGAQWSLRYAFMLFVIGTILAILLPAKVDSVEGEEQADLLSSGERPRAVVVGGAVRGGLLSNTGLRLLSGFLTIFMAFALREPPDSLWTANPTLLLGLVIGGAGLGNTIGIVLGNILKPRSPERVAILVLFIDVIAVSVTAIFFTWWSAVLLAVTVGVCQSLGKLSLDALIQRDISESIRTSVFARSETLLQLSWVVGGLIGIGLFALETTAHIGLLIVATILIVWLVFVVTHLRRSPQPAHVT